MSVGRRVSALRGSVVVAGALGIATVLAAPPASAAVATPSVSSTSPASPNPSTTPLVKGSAPSGATVVLYSNNSCSSSSLGRKVPFSATAFAHGTEAAPGM